MKDWIRSTSLALVSFLVLKCVYIIFLIWDIILGASNDYNNENVWILFEVLGILFVCELVRTIATLIIVTYLKCVKKLKFSQFRDMLMNQTTKKRITDRVRA